MSDKFDIKVILSEEHEEKDDDKSNNKPDSHKIMDVPSSIFKNNLKAKNKSIKIEELIFNVRADTKKNIDLSELPSVTLTNNKTNDSEPISDVQKDFKSVDKYNNLENLKVKVPDDDENKSLKESNGKEKRDYIDMDRRDPSKDMWIFNMGTYNKYNHNKIGLK